ncbi:MAG TPA: dethiobiotin synthase [Verrucomicrobiales bacterium]|nr:dethiobiotin synthase [Verrucomicrobiales bacterium]
MPDTSTGWFVTGTDTGVGKTYVCRLLLAALCRAGHRAVGYKPVCCGSRADATLLREAGAGGPALNEINPLWFRAPMSPLAAGRIEDRIADLDALVEGYRLLATRFDGVVVEGAGGWKAPLTPGATMADLALRLNLPVLVVTHNRLGALNHTLLTVESILAAGLTCSGVILNQVEETRDAASIANRSILEEFLPVPVLGEILHGNDALGFEFAGLGLRRASPLSFRARSALAREGDSGHR